LFLARFWEKKIYIQGDAARLVPTEFGCNTFSESLWNTTHSSFNSRFVSLISKWHSFDALDHIYWVAHEKVTF